MPFGPDTRQHLPVRGWLERFISSERVFGIPDIVLLGFLRTVTRAPFNPPSDLSDAWRFVRALTRASSCSILHGSAAHLEHFRELSSASKATRNLLTDAFIAAFALAFDGEVVTCDRDFAAFPGLTWRNPIDDQPVTNPR